MSLCGVGCRPLSRFHGLRARVTSTRRPRPAMLHRGDRSAMNRPEPIARMDVAAPRPRDGAPRAGRIGVLLVNLGTPDATDAASVRRYLKEFLSDRRVIENQGPLWNFILNGVILRIRPHR